MKHFSAIVSSVLLGIFAYFQLNDPDPVQWVFAYLMPILALNFIKSKQYLLGMATGYFVAAVLQWPPAFEGFLFDTLKMRSLNIELARESGGLAIVALILVLNALSLK